MTVEKYAVIGNPIEHSKSPLIHQSFARQFNKSIVYEKLWVPLNGFTGEIRRLQTAGYRGVNVTVPFKFEAFDVCQSVTLRAQAAGAVNTLSFEGVQLSGDNTDGYGLVSDILKNRQVQLMGKNILLLGAGGAAQGVILPLLQQHPAALHVANRTPAKAQAVVDKFSADALYHHTVLKLQTLAELSQAYDIVINATAAGLTDSPLYLPPVVFKSTTLAYDMMYGRETIFMQQAQACGALVVDGLGMLVEQAAEAFYLWHGLRPETASVIQSLRQS